MAAPCDDDEAPNPCEIASVPPCTPPPDRWARSAPSTRSRSPGRPAVLPATSTPTRWDGRQPDAPGRRSARPRTGHDGEQYTPRLPPGLLHAANFEVNEADGALLLASPPHAPGRAPQPGLARPYRGLIRETTRRSRGGGHSGAKSTISTRWASRRIGPAGFAWQYRSPRDLARRLISEPPRVEASPV